MNDDKLVNRLRLHDEEALLEAVRKYTPLISSVIGNISNGLLKDEDIEECTSDVFYTLWINAGKIQSNHLKGYLCAIAKTKAKDMLRGIKLVDSDDIDDLSVADEFSLYEHLDNKQLQTDLAAAFDQFDDQERDILIRHFYYYQSASVIAELKGLNKEAVKSKIRRAKPKLREFLRERGYFYENR